MVLDSVLLVVGLVLLFVGGEALVRGAVSLADRFGLSPLVIGLTVVGFGTSMPELLVSLQAALRGAPDIAVGNVVGSNIANILLILGVSAMISPMAVRIAGLGRDLAVMLAAAVALLLLGLTGEIGRLAGAMMLVGLIVYIGFATVSGRRDCEKCSEAPVRLAAWKEALLLVFGFGALLVGADSLVGAAIRIARTAGVSEAVIGLTIVAVGTSLPELATSLVAAFRKHSEVAIGNVVGSNIFNTLGILGVTALVEPVSIAHSIAALDIPLMLAISAGLVCLVLLARHLTRATGVALLCCYTIYVGFLF